MADKEPKFTRDLPESRRRQLIEEPARRHELRPARPLREIAGDDDEVRIGTRHIASQLRDDGGVDTAEVQIGEVDDRLHSGNDMASP